MLLWFQKDGCIRTCGSCGCTIVTRKISLNNCRCISKHRTGSINWYNVRYQGDRSPELPYHNVMDGSSGTSSMMVCLGEHLAFYCSIGQFGEGTVGRIGLPK